MSAGLNFLRSVIESGSSNLLRRCEANLFLEDELPAFQFVRTYHQTYGVLPTVDILQKEGHPLPTLRRAGGSASYYYTTLRRRYAYSEVNTRHPRLVECMKNRDMDGLSTVLREMLAASHTASGEVHSTTLAEELEGVLDEYRIARRSPGLRGLPTGWSTLDMATNGVMGGDLVVIVGRPSMGKSYLLQEMARAANVAGYTVAVTSMEMTKSQLTRRWLGRESRINPNLIRSGELGTYSHRHLMGVADLLRNSPTPVHLLAGNMKKSVRAIETMVLETNPQALYIDAAYLLSPAGRKQGYVSKWETISEVVGELKVLALEYNIPVVISVQFNRGVRSNSTALRKSLDMGDIAGSDSIPQDASVVLGIRKGRPPMDRVTRIIEVMKNREGETPVFATSFTFSPVNMEEIPLVDADPDSVEEGEAPPVTRTNLQDMGWMQ